jgi:hypothetical protein
MAAGETVTITDKATGQFKGFGFVMFATPEEAALAINALNGYDWSGRQIVIWSPTCNCWMARIASCGEVLIAREKHKNLFPTGGQSSILPSKLTE